jgi:hypothetical protein
VLGVLPPGEALPLPWGSTRDSPPYELQVRPLYVPAAHAPDGAPLPAAEPCTRWSVPVLAEPGAASAVAALGALARGADVEVWGRTKANDWLAVRTLDHQVCGWVSQQYVTEAAP